MNIKNQKILEDFNDKEIRYILQYAHSQLEKSFNPGDGTLQGSILERLQKIIFKIKE